MSGWDARRNSRPACPFPGRVRSRVSWLGAALIVAVSLVSGAGRAAEGMDAAALVPADGVRDPVFAVLLGFVLDNHTGEMDSTRVRAEVEKIGRKPKLPYKMIEAVTRLPETSEAAQYSVTSRFIREIDLPVPYQILGYHPGSFQGASRLDFREIGLGVQNVPYAERMDKHVETRLVRLEDTRLYVLETGKLQIDIDGWLDRLAGGKLDDTRVAGLVIFRKDGHLYGMALGYNRKGQPRSGTIAFAEDKILYPNPPELRAVARQMRRVLERVNPEIPKTYAKW